MDDDMLPEYDFTGKTGVRGKYYQQLRAGYTIEIHQEDGTVLVQRVAPAEDLIQLDPDVREYFPDAEAVNHALRTLIQLVPPRRSHKSAIAASDERSKKMLSSADRRIADRFRAQLQKLVTPLDVRVFGSRARGDASPDSDLDIYIELEEITPQLREQISEVAWLVGFDNGCVLSTFVVTREQLVYGALGASPLVAAVMREGQPV